MSLFLNIVLPALSSFPLAVAPDEFPQMEYTYVEANYVWADSDYSSDNLDGVDLTGSFELPANFFLQATVRDQSASSDVTGYRVGAGWHMGFVSRFDAYAILQYAHLEVSSSNSDFTDDGIGAELGLRMMLTKSIELNTRVLYADVGNNDSSFGLGARYYFNGTLSVGARVDTGNAETSVSSGLRFEL
jgi:Outer membrane protein beta-barrel domain